MTEQHDILDDAVWRMRYVDDPDPDRRARVDRQVAIASAQALIDIARSLRAIVAQIEKAMASD